jgi:hypothetical protein
MNGAAMTKGRFFRRFLIGLSYSWVLVFFLLPGVLGAGGRRDIKTIELEGQEIWEAEFDIGRLKTGKHNIIIRARDPAGNIAEDGPYNIRVDPRAGLPLARVVYPENNSVVREGVSIIGVATGRFGVSEVSLRLNNGAPQPLEGTEYWGLDLGDDLAEGRYTVSVQARDLKSTPGPFHTISFVVDRTPPDAGITSHKSGDFIGGNVNIAGFASDINGIQTLEISLDGGADYRPLPFKPRRGSKVENAEVDFSFRLRTKDMADGPLLYIIRATDVTGLTTMKSYLFYVDNVGPELDIISPKVDEAVWDTIRVTGSIFDAVGVEKFFYEWNGETVDIPIFPGDPYWSALVTIPYRMYRGNIFRVTAIDKVGNTTVISRQFRDLRKVRSPTLVIDYPRSLTDLAADQPIYGRIAPGYDPATIIIEGVVEEIDALPAFKIPPELIAAGRSSLRIWAKAADDSLGDPVLLRTNRPHPAPGSAKPPTELTITSPGPYGWFRDSLVIEGRIGGEGGSPGNMSGGRLEYRLGPEDTWKPVTFNQATGAFTANVPVSYVEEGPVHFEMRTILGGVEHAPFYYPLNRFLRDPDIQFVSPALDRGPVNGQVTVSGVVYSAVPVTDVEFTSNGRDYEPVGILSAYQKYSFSMPVNFSKVAEARGKLMVRITDLGGNRYEKALEVEMDPASDSPRIILNTPIIGQVITGDFLISGLAFDDDQTEAVYWRVVKRPRSSGAASAANSMASSEAAEAASAAGSGVSMDSGPEFQRVSTPQNFEIPVSMTELEDGEHFVEVFGEDIYGFRGRVLARLIYVSTAAPVVQVVSPPITVYNKKVIYIEGTAFDLNGMGEIRASLDNGLTWQRAEIMGDRWRLSLNTAAYGDGVYNIFVRAFDKCGVESFMNALINMDNTPPDLVVSIPANGAIAGNELELISRVQDNVEVAKLSVHLVNIADSNRTLNYNVEPRAVVQESIDIRSLPVGEYNMRMLAVDLADNETVINRNFSIVRDNTIAEAAFYNPLPGINHTGPLFVSGRITGAFLPEEVTLRVNRTEFAKVPVDRFGLFNYEYPAEGFNEEVQVVFSASFNNPTGGVITSHNHEVRIQPYGATVVVDSHTDGDPITGRPWLSGRAWYTDAVLLERQRAGGRLSWNEERFYDVAAVDVSYDNGRTYQRAVGKENWKFRLETGEMSRGPLPVLIKATFANGAIAIRRLYLIVDVDPPDIKTLDPIENSLHRDTLAVNGIASDDYEIASIEVQLRPGDKIGYSVPKFIQGMYFDTNIFGATYGDFALGLAFFENNVKLQFQYGEAPPGRFDGHVLGFKLLANILYLPLDYYFGPDWIPFSMAFGLGANFSYFTMEAGIDPLILGAVLAQWEFLRVTLVQPDPYTEVKLRWFKYFSFYFEPVIWFASTDVVNVESRIFRATLGVKIGIL